MAKATKTTHRNVHTITDADGYRETFAVNGDWVTIETWDAKGHSMGRPTFARRVKARMIYRQSWRVANGEWVQEIGPDGQPKVVFRPKVLKPAKPALPVGISIQKIG